MRLVRLSGFSSVPLVMNWKNAMIRISDSSMPYSRMLLLTKLPTLRCWLVSSVAKVCCAISILPAISLVPGFHDRAHDLFLAGFPGRHLADHPALVHHIDAVADAEQLRHLGGDDDDALPLLRQARDDGVDLELGADIDAARRLVQDQDLRSGEQPLAEHHLLLVAAGTVHRLLEHAGAADVEVAAVFVRDRLLLPVVDHRIPRYAREVRQGDVALDVVDQHQAVVLAVLGHIGDAGLHRLVDGGDVDLLAVQQDLAADLLAVGAAEDAHGELGAAGAHQAGNADDLALADIEIDAFDHLPVGMFPVVDDPVLHFEDRVADLGMALRIAVSQLAPHHAPDDAVLVDLLRMAVEPVDRRAVSQDGDGVGDLQDLVQLVRDEDRGNAVRPELLEQRQQRVAVALVEAGGRLVEDQQLHLLGEGLGDLHQLLLADAEVGDEGVGRFLEADLLQQRARLGERGMPVDDAVLRGLVAEKDVLGDREQRHQRQLLVNDDDAGLLAVRDVAKPAFFALEEDLAGIVAVRIDAAQHLHQG